MKYYKTFLLSILIITLSTSCKRQVPENKLAEVVLTNLKCEHDHRRKESSFNTKNIKELKKLYRHMKRAC